MNEQWSSIAGYESLYEVSNFGRVRRIGKPRNGYPSNNVLSPTLGDEGYLQVILYKQGKPRGFLVGRLVALTFLPIPIELLLLDSGKLEVNHINPHAKTDNRISNLEWVSSKQNMEQAARDGLIVSSKLTVTQVIEIKQMLNDGIYSYRQIAAKFGVTYGQIAHICKGKAWSHVGPPVTTSRNIKPGPKPKVLITGVTNSLEVQNK